MGKAEINLNALEVKIEVVLIFKNCSALYTRPQRNNQNARRFCSVESPCRASCVKNSSKKELGLTFFNEAVLTYKLNRLQRQELRELDQQRDEMAKRMNNQGTRKAVIKTRLQKILKDRNMRKQAEWVLNFLLVLCYLPLFLTGLKKKNKKYFALLSNNPLFWFLFLD